MDINKLHAAVQLDEALDRLGFQAWAPSERKARLLFAIREFAVLSGNSNLEKACDEKLGKMPEVTIIRGVLQVVP